MTKVHKPCQHIDIMLLEKGKNKYATNYKNSDNNLGTLLSG